MSVLLAAAVTLAAGAALAGSDIYLCQDAEGRKTYQNTGAGKGCTRLDVPRVLTVPAPRQQAARVPAEARPISPASFPRVDSQTQKTRDGDRRRILEDELGAEEAKMQALRSEYNGGAPERLASERSDTRYQPSAIPRSTPISSRMRLSASAPGSLPVCRPAKRRTTWSTGWST